RSRLHKKSKKICSALTQLCVWLNALCCLRFRNFAYQVGYLAKYDLLQFARKDRHFINSPDQLAQLVGFELGYTVVTKQFFEQYCDQSKVIILKDNWFYDHEISLCWYDRGVLPSYFKALIDAIN
ncbi:hypothetical protein, partial [Cysteiniphilum sp. JM-1]|uniref:hypothetical protein n=1 Tax=Cysteiniphilum sp. JM-1 TaxID=2610891 RepID=UPI001CD11480